MALLEAAGIVKHYALGKTTVEALCGVDLSVQAGDFLAIAGPSGSGKSTLLNLMGCLEKPTQGTIQIDGIAVSKLTADERAEIRSEKIGFIFQTFNLLPVLTALENIEYPLLNFDLPPAVRNTRAREALRQVELENFANHKPMELSGGQRQRVAIARAIVTRPCIILADEPTANLDHKTGQTILDLMQRLNRELETTFIFSTHDPQVMAMARTTVHLFDGKIIRP